MGAFVWRCCMLLFILHWMSLESNWQICCLLFISFHIFALLSLFSSFGSRGVLFVTVILAFFFPFCSLCSLSQFARCWIHADTLLFTLHDILYILCGTFFSFVLFATAALFTALFYGAKFVVIAHTKHILKPTLNMLCTAFHHNLWIWIRSSKKKEEESHIDYNLLDWICVWTLNNVERWGEWRCGWPVLLHFYTGIIIVFCLLSLFGPVFLCANSHTIRMAFVEKPLL